MRISMLAAIAALAGWAAAARAEDGVVVAGLGEIRVKPDRLEIELRNNGVAEIAGDASVKLRDAQNRTAQALEKLKVPGLKIEAALLSAGHEAISQQRYYNGNEMPAANPKIELARQSKIVVDGIDKLSDAERLALVSKVLDAARDAGAKLGTNRPPLYDGTQYTTAGFLRFTLADPAAAKDGATKKAFADAEEKAKKLAALAGRSLGPPLEIVEEPPAGAGAVPMPGMPAISAAAEDGGDLPIRVKLKVRFALKAGG